MSWHRAVVVGSVHAVPALHDASRLQPVESITVSTHSYPVALGGVCNRGLQLRTVNAYVITYCMVVY